MENLKNVCRCDIIRFFLRLHKRLVIFALLYLVLQFMPLAILLVASSTLPPQHRFLLMLITSLSLPPLFVYQLILSRGPGGVMYYAHAINMVGILLAMSREHFTYIYSKTLALAQFLFLHPGPLMTLFIVVEYILFKYFLRKAIKYKLISLFWTLGPILYITTLLPVLVTVIKILASPMPPTTYHFPPQLGYIAWFFYYAMPGPFISLVTLPKYLRRVKQNIITSTT